MEQERNKNTYYFLKVEGCFIEPLISLKTAVIEKKVWSNGIACISEEENITEIRRMLLIVKKAW